MLHLKIVYMGLLGLLAIKVVANFSVPFELTKKKEGEGISVMLGLDVVLMVLLTALAYGLNEPGSLFHWKATLLWVGGATIGSIVFMFGGSMFAGWLRARKSSGPSEL